MSIFKDEEVVNKQFFEEFGTDLTFQISYGLIVNQIMCSKYDSILSDCITNGKINLTTVLWNAEDN